MRLLTLLVRRFVAGETAEEAMRVVRRLNSLGITTTIDILGENVSDVVQARRAGDAYVRLLDVIAGEGVQSHVSVKLTQTGLDISDDLVFDNMRRILACAKRHDNFVRIDMEGSPYTQRTLDLFRRLLGEYSNVGCVIQAYLYRSEHDVEALNRLHAKVRLCKGAYKEAPSIAFRDKRDVNANYVRLMKALMVNGNYPAIATHDEAIINEAKAYARKRGIEPAKFEFQMLYGIRMGLQERLAAAGYNVRCYVPFGTHWLPYFLRRLRERRENIVFVVRNLFRR